MRTKTKLLLNPVFWGIVIFILTQGLTFLAISNENVFLKKNNIELPTQPPEVISLWPGPVTSSTGQVTEVPAVSSLGPILIYFFAVVIILGVILFTIPISALKMVFKVIFAFLFCWSIFVITILWLPWVASLSIALFVSLVWFFQPRVWLHGLVMIGAMTALGEVFGRLISPWTAMIILAALAIYDFLAVRFGFMVWMANKLSLSTTLPAFFIPYRLNGWANNLNKSNVSDLTKQKSEEREYSLLGGGDIGFPVLLASSVYFAHGASQGLIVAGFSLIGLVAAYLIQMKFLKGKAIPALPPIAVFSAIGLALVSFVI